MPTSRAYVAKARQAPLGNEEPWRAAVARGRAAATLPRPSEIASVKPKSCIPAAASVVVNGWPARWKRACIMPLAMNRYRT